MKSLFSFFNRKRNLTVDGVLLIDKGFRKAQIDFLKEQFSYFPDNTQVSIAFLNKDEVVFAGVKREKDSLVYCENRDSVFEIGSVTKVFTSVLLSKFINEGLVKSDDPIKDFFDFLLKQSGLNNKEITLAHLANHTSGLPRIDIAMVLRKEIADRKNPYKNYTEENLNDYLKNRMKLYYEPGTKFKYSNLGGGLLGYILRKKANKTYEELLQENIFIPLGMKNSTTDLTKAFTIRESSLHVKGLTKKGEIAENWDHTDATAGAGAIKSTSEDMAKFIQAHFNDNKILQIPLQKTFTIKKYISIGLGWVITQKEIRTIHWHNGGTAGYRTCIALDVSNKKGIIILSNVSASHPKSKKIDELCFSLLESIE